MSLELKRLDRFHVGRIQNQDALAQGTKGKRAVFEYMALDSNCKLGTIKDLSLLQLAAETHLMCLSPGISIHYSGIL